MELENHCSLSTFALLSQITDGDWKTAYAALLDLTGSFRKHHKNDFPAVRAQILDTVAELHLSGRVADATKLVNLTQACDYPALAVLLQCSRSTRQGFSPSRISAFKMTPLNDASPDSVIPLCASPRIGFPGFANFDTMEGPEEMTMDNVGNTFQPGANADDCIESAARFAQEQHQSWMLSKLRRSVEDVHLASHELYSDVKFVNFFGAKQEGVLMDRPLCPLSSLENGNAFFANGKGSVEHDDALLEHIFNKCITCSCKVTAYANFLSVSDATESTNEWKDLLLRRQTARTNSKKIREYIASQKVQKGEILDATTRAALCGDVYQDVLTFAEMYAGAASGRVLEAVANFAFEISRTYFCALFERAYGESVTTSCRPWLTLEVAESYLPNLVSLAELLRRIEQTDQSACAILNTLFDCGSQFSENRMYQDLFTRAIGPYATSIKDWVMDGSLQRDLTGEFFGYRLGVEVTASENLYHFGKESNLSAGLQSSAVVPKLLELEDALFVLRAGRSRELLKGLYPDFSSGLENEDSVPNSRCSCFTKQQSPAREIWDLDSYTQRTTSMQCLEMPNQIAKGAEGRLVKDIQLQSSTSIGPMPAGHREICREKCFLLPASLPRSRRRKHRLTLFSAMSSIRAVKTSHSPGCPIAHSRAGDIPLTVPQYSKTLLAPLRLCDDLVQRKVLTHFVEELHVFEHFKNLRAHVLLGAGDFANILVDQINAAARLSEENERYIERRANAALTFYGTAGPGVRSIRDQVHLNRCLYMALNLYSHESNAFASCLSLDATEDDMARKISLWETTIEVQYKVAYPLNLLFSSEVLFMYSKIFNLILRVLRAKRSLRSLFLMSRRNSALRRKAQARFLSTTETQSVLWEFCWQAEHFVTIFGGFQMDQVLGPAWNTFECSWDVSNTIWELRDNHVHYLKDCIRRCLLSPTHKSVLGVMSEGFDIVVNVEKQVSSVIEEASMLTGTSAHNVFDLLTSSSASLRRRVVFLQDVLKRLLDEGMCSHVEELLVRLSFGKHHGP